MNKNYFKLTLDIFMTVIFILVLKISHGVSVFHELAGLAFSFFILIHLLLNGTWITKVTTKLFNQTLPRKNRLSGFLNILLLIMVIGITVTGIMISQVVFPTAVGVSRVYKGLHELFSYLSLLLIGIHISLNWRWICNCIKKIPTIKPHKIATGIGMLVIVLGIMVGGYQVLATQFNINDKYTTIPNNGHPVFDRDH